MGHWHGNIRFTGFHTDRRRQYESRIDKLKNNDLILVLECSNVSNVDNEEWSNPRIYRVVDDFYLCEQFGSRKSGLTLSLLKSSSPFYRVPKHLMPTFKDKPMTALLIVKIMKGKKVNYPRSGRLNT